MEKQPETKKLSFKINGLEQDLGRVRLSVFKEKLDQLGKILSDAERQAAHVKKARANFLVSDLKQASAYMEIAPFEQDGYAGSVMAVDFLGEVLSQIESGAPSLGNIESSIVKKIKTICIGSKQSFHSQVLVIEDSQFVFDDNLAAKAQRYLDKKYFSTGEIKGRIERVNIHDRADFFLYPLFGDGAVTCHFKTDELLEQVRQALGKVVIATGQLEFIGTDANPISANILTVEIQPENYAPPGVDDLFGMAPNISADMDITDYIRNIRDEWERH